ncbi:MAG: hypothetical protein JNK23_10700 [Opitutaceae bacterium]|nr:hypothetical protein [Opitutaceae bacterium]
MPAPIDTTRSRAIHIYTDFGTDYRVEIDRETRRSYENGDTKRIAGRTLVRPLSAIAATTVPGGPVTITTYADLAALIAECATALAATEPNIPAISDP